jgi:hypothetical protein
LEETRAIGWRMDSLSSIRKGCVVQVPMEKKNTVWLKKRENSMEGSWFEHYTKWDREADEYEDCCGLSDEDD